MESLEDSNCPSMSDSFSLYERYMRSFNIVDNIIDEGDNPEASQPVSSNNCGYESSDSRGNIDLSALRQTNDSDKTNSESDSTLNPSTRDYIFYKGIDTERRTEFSSASLTASLLQNSSASVEHSLLSDKSDNSDVHASSENSKQGIKQPMFITSTMENSNNAVDSVRLFRDLGPSDNVFKLPVSELSFNGTLKHVKKLKPIVDPITALSSSTGLVNLDEKSTESVVSAGDDFCSKISDSSEDTSYTEESIREEKMSENTGDSQYEELKNKKEGPVLVDENSVAKWNSDQSYSSLEASFDSGVRSPDMFSDGDEDEVVPTPEPFWSFIKDHEAFDKRKSRKIEEALQGVLPPPSVTILKTDVTEILKKYYCYLPMFDTTKVKPDEVNSVTPTKRVSFVEIPEKTQDKGSQTKCHINTDSSENDLDRSTDKTIDLKMCTEVEATETSWPDVVKCRHYDVYYNITKYSEKIELLALRYGERYVGAETDTSVNVHSGGFQSPSSASKRKAFRLKMAQAKSPGRRLSHLARRRQAFCSAATINEKAQASASKMVLIDKNFFPHRKLINSAERRSPRGRRTPGKRTPVRKTPGKKTPAKTPKTRSGGSSKKKAMRRLLMDPEHLTRSQPHPNTTSAPSSTSSTASKTRRVLFGSPSAAETKSMDGTQSDHFFKRKREMFDDGPELGRSKIAKSLSFGGDSIGASMSVSFSRRASEVFASKTSAELNEHHKKKLLWAVSEALRVHGWRMSSPGFREKASALAQLTRRLLTLPPHSARFATPTLSTSETMLKLARQYVFAIIQGRSVDDCFEEEQTKLQNSASSKLTGYISATAYQQRALRPAAAPSRIKENTGTSSLKQDQPKSGTKNVLQDKLLNIDTNSSSSGCSVFDKSNVGFFKSNSMPSFEDAAKLRVRKQISFDNVDFPKR